MLLAHNKSTGYFRYAYVRELLGADAATNRELHRLLAERDTQRDEVRFSALDLGADPTSTAVNQQMAELNKPIEDKIDALLGDRAPAFRDWRN